MWLSVPALSGEENKYIYRITIKLDVMERDHQEISLFEKGGIVLAIPDVPDSEIPLGTGVKLMESAGLDGSVKPALRADEDAIADAIGPDHRIVISAYIEPGTDGFWSYTYSPEDVGAYGYGRTIREVKKSLLDGIEMVKERYGEMDDQKMMPHSIRGDYRVEFDIQPSLRDYPDDLEIKK